ncbi:MAG: hypothetical protein CG440_941 [Methanosaeta sp. NSM2]|nr:MAG: hypothetical protein CG440_941 [Methanosaeta sp. NSM2]
MTAAAPKEIETLVEEFERDQSFYKSSQFNETELRTRFINPLIAALGWDVYPIMICPAGPISTRSRRRTRWRWRARSRIPTTASDCSTAP